MNVDPRPICLGLLALAGGVAWPAQNPETYPWSRGVVEVRGLVLQPGFHEVTRPVRLHAALLAAGEMPRVMDRVIGPGMRVNVGAQGLSVGPSDARLSLGLRLSIQQATKSALEQLPGIGPVRAQAIGAYRAQQGPFPSLDALTEVHGIGVRTLDRVAPYLSVY